jgi:hypothetical protein
MVGTDRPGIEALFRLVAAGEVRPLVGSEHRFGDLPQAVSRSLDGHSVGKNLVALR